MFVSVAWRRRFIDSLVVDGFLAAGGEQEHGSEERQRAERRRTGP